MCKGRGPTLLLSNLTQLTPTVQYCASTTEDIGRRAGSTVTVCARVQCREPKTGQHKVQFSRKTKYFAHLGI